MLAARITKEMCSLMRIIFPEKMKIKATEYLIVDNGNTEVINRKESLLTKISLQTSRN